MFVISRTFVAVNILRHLAVHEGILIASTNLSKEIGVPLPYARKVANQLIRAGLIKSVRGSTGGYRLARPASAIRLGDVLKVIDDTRVGGAQPGPDAAALSGVLDEARLKFIDVLNEHSITDLCAQQSRSREAKNRYSRIPAPRVSLQTDAKS